jgi:hypothetical protein
VTFRQLLLGTAHDLMRRSLDASIRQQSMTALRIRLQEINPDISDQYTSFKIPQEDHYITTKLRSQHAFQVKLANKTIDLMRRQVGEKAKIKIADIGDSSGTHTKYIRGVISNSDYLDIKSVNLDPIAIEKIRSRGYEALLCRAENLQADCGFSADIFFAFEVLEHLMDPIRFLREIAVRTGCRYFGVTVPLVHKSRLGLQYIRYSSNKPAVAEDTHIFELCPDDWNLLFKFSGWRVVHEEQYRQYPNYHTLTLTRPLWRRLDLEGFLGVILERDMSLSDQYKSW